MALSDLQVFNDFSYSSMTETIDQQVNLFNEASRGGIVLRSANNVGDYNEKAHWKKITGLVRRRNAYGTGSAGTAALAQLLETSVKIAAGTPSVDIQPGMMRWIQKDPEEAGIKYGEQLAEASMQDMLNSAIAAYVAGIGAISTVKYDGTAGNTSLSSLNDTKRLFGDAAQNIMAWIMHSKSAFDVWGAAITNANTLFTFGTLMIKDDGLGVPIIMTDSPDLFFLNVATNNYYQLGLSDGAMVIEQNNDYDDNISTTNGSDNIARTVQAEWSFNLGIKGLTWDKANGGASPTDAEIATATNWDRSATDDKGLAGVIGVTL